MAKGLLKGMTMAAGGFLLSLSLTAGAQTAADYDGMTSEQIAAQLMEQGMTPDQIATALAAAGVDGSTIAQVLVAAGVPADDAATVASQAVVDTPRAPQPQSPDQTPNPTGVADNEDPAGQVVGPNGVAFNASTQEDVALFMLINLAQNLQNNPGMLNDRFVLQNVANAIASSMGVSQDQVMLALGNANQQGNLSEDDLIAQIEDTTGQNVPGTPVSPN